jgi:hypothetical protein
MLALAVMSGCGGEEQSTGGARPATSTGGVEIAALSGPRVAEDRMPADLAAKVEAFGMDPADSRYAREFEGEPVYLLPSPEVTCLFSGNDAVAGCWGTSAVAGGFATSTALCGPALPRGKVATFGIVHDGVEKVRVLRTNVPDGRVPVEGNVYVAMTSSEPPLPAQLVREGNGTRAVQQTGLPPRIVKEGCDAPLEPVRPARSAPGKSR